MVRVDYVHRVKGLEGIATKTMENDSDSDITTRYQAGFGIGTI